MKAPVLAPLKVRVPSGRSSRKIAAEFGAINLRRGVGKIAEEGRVGPR